MDATVVPRRLPSVLWLVVEGARSRIDAVPVLAVATGAGTFALYVVGAGRSYDYDSSWTVGTFVATPSLLDPLRRQQGFNNHPLFSLLEHVVYSGGGRSEAAMRVLPAVFAAATVVLLVLWAGRRFGLFAGGSAGLLVAANPLFADEARAVRGYSLLCLCALASTLLLVRLLERDEAGGGVAYLLAVAAGIATHLYMLVVVVARIAAVLAARRLSRRWLVRSAAAILLGGSVYAGRGEDAHLQRERRRQEYWVWAPSPSSEILGGVRVGSRRRKRPQQPPLLGEPLGDREAAGRVQPAVADPVAPVGVLAVKLEQRAETPRRPETRLEVAHRGLDRPLLARRRRRAGGGVEAVVVAQVQEATIPHHLLALAAATTERRLS